MVTVSRSGLFIEVDDGWLNSGFRPIRCVSPNCVCNIYRLSCFSSWQQYLSRLFRARSMIPSDTFTTWSGY